jgi:hypothetical protein
MTDDGRPDQLDVQIAMAVNAIRRAASEARHRLGQEPVDYEYMTADMVVADDA